MIDGKRNLLQRVTPPGFCSMKTTQDVRNYAEKQGVEAEKAVAVGMSERAKEFAETGVDIYRG